MSDGGYASALVIALLGLAAFTCLAVADAANVLAARERASAAADAAALAAAVEQWPFLGLGTEPQGAARRIAEANGARFESCACPARGEAEVTVSVATRARMLRAVARVHATAHASVDPASLFRPP